MRDGAKEQGKFVYFIRTDSSQRLSRVSFLEQVSHGQIQGGSEGADDVATLLSELFVPILAKPTAGMSALSAAPASRPTASALLISTQRTMPTHLLYGHEREDEENRIDTNCTGPFWDWTGWDQRKEHDCLATADLLESLVEKLKAVSADSRRAVVLVDASAKRLVGRLKTGRSASSATQARALQNQCEDILELWCKQLDRVLKESVEHSTPAAADVEGTSVAAWAPRESACSIDVQGPLEELGMWRERKMRLQYVFQQFHSDDAKQVLLINVKGHTKASRVWQVMEGKLCDALVHAEQCVKCLSTMEPKLRVLYTTADVHHLIACVRPCVLGAVELCMSAKVYQSGGNLQKFMVRLVRQMIMAVKRTLYDNGNGPPALWWRDKQLTLGDIRAAHDTLTTLKAQLLKATTELSANFNKVNVKAALDLKTNVILLDLDPLILRLEQLSTVFDAWSRYDKLGSLRVPLPGVHAVLEDFNALTDELTTHKTCCDYLDSLDRYGDFSRGILDFHLNLANLDQRLWFLLESAVCGMTTNEPNSGRQLSTSNALQLMNDFEAVYSRSNFHSQPEDGAAAQTWESEQSVHASAAMSPFNPWMGVEKLYFQVLRRLLDEQRQIQSEYEQHKHKPPKLRNESPVIQHIFWAQHLQRRVRSTIADCQFVPDSLRSAPIFRKVMRIASNAESVLIEYLSRWHTAWLESVELTKSGLNATLLVRHPVHGGLCVNFDLGIHELIRDAKGFLRAGYELPAPSLKILEREVELKTYYNALSEAIQKFDDCISRIPFLLRPLFADMVEDLTAKLEPGCVTLTWVSVNIDAFLASVEEGIDSLNAVVERSTMLMMVKIERVLKNVRGTSLIDISEERTYTLGGGGLEKFVSDQRQVISQRAAAVAAQIRSAEEATEALVALVPIPYGFSTQDNHFERDLKIRLGYLAYQATRGCVLNSLDILKRRLTAKGTGLFYMTRPIFDVDVELQYPNVSLVPSLAEVQEAINDVAMHVLSATRHTSMWGTSPAERENERFLTNEERSARSMHVHIAQDRLVVKQLVMLAGGLEQLKKSVTDYIQPFHRYDFLWKTDKASALEAFCLEARIPYQAIQKRSPTEWNNDFYASLPELGERKRGIETSSLSTPVDRIQNGKTTGRASDSTPANKATPNYEGLKLDHFLRGIEQSATALDNPVLDMELLKLIQSEMLAQWRLEQEVSSILPVHNIGPLSLDTVSLKNVLKAEARSFKLIYAKILLAHAQGLLAKLDVQVSGVLDILHRPRENEAASVHDMIQMVNALTEAEQFEKTREIPLLMVTLVLDWTQACGVVVQRMQNDFNLLHSRVVSMMHHADIVQTFVSQDREVLIGELELEIVSLKKETRLMSRELLEEEGPLARDAQVGFARAQMQQLKPRLRILSERWHAVADAEHALQLQRSDLSVLKKLEESIVWSQRLFDLESEAIEMLHHVLSHPIKDAHIHFQAVFKVLDKMSDKMLSINGCVTGSATYAELQRRLQHISDNLRVLGRFDLSDMKCHHWEHVIKKSAERGREPDTSEKVADLHESTFWTDVMAGKVSHQASALISKEKRSQSATELRILDVIRHDLTNIVVTSCLERMSQLASKEKTMMLLLHHLEFQWRNEHFEFSAHTTSAATTMFMINHLWAENTAQDLEHSLLALSVQVGNYAVSHHFADADEITDSENHTARLQAEIEAWREALASTSRCVQEIMQIQHQWLSLSLLYQDPQVRLKQPNATRQFQLAEQQLLHVLRQMKESTSILHFCTAQPDPFELLALLRHQFELAAKSLSTMLDQQRSLFPRLFFLNDAGMISLQYSFMNDRSHLRDFLPQIFDGIADVLFTSAEDSSGKSGFSPHALAGRDMSNASACLASRTTSHTSSRGQNAKNPETRTRRGHKESTGEVIRKHNEVATGVMDAEGQVLSFRREELGHHSLHPDREGSNSGQELGPAVRSKQIHYFLQQILSRTSDELKRELAEARENLLSNNDHLKMSMGDVEAMINLFSPQTVQTCLRITWTASVEQLFERAAKSTSAGSISRTFPRALEGMSSMLVSSIDNLLSQGSSVRSRSLSMKRIAGTVVVLLSLRDATDALGKAYPEVSHLSDFAWLKVPRLYYNSHAKCYWLGILDTQMICREEWQGSNPTVVVLTPGFQRGLMGITQASSGGFASLLTGSAATGKKTLAQSLSRLCGCFLYLHPCLPQNTSASTIERMLKGMELATDTWLMFDRLPSLSLPLLAVLAANLQTVLTRASSLLAVARGGSGAGAERLSGATHQQGPVVLASWPSSSGPRRGLLPCLREQFRPVCMSKPDELHMMQVLLAANGISEYASTARKLHALISVLRRHPLLSSSHLDFGLKMSLKAIHAAINAHQHMSDVNAEAFVLAAMHTVLPRLTEQEHKMVSSITNDVLGPLRSTSLPSYDNLYDDSSLQVQIDSLWAAMGLKNNVSLKGAVVRLLESIQTHGLLCISGAARTGKSTALQMAALLVVLQRAPECDLVQLARSFLMRQASGCAGQHCCEGANKISGHSTRVSILRLHPCAMSWQRFGFVFEDQWQALTQGVKSITCAGPHRVQLIVLDGHTPCVWVETLLATYPSLGDVVAWGMGQSETDTGDVRRRVKLVIEDLEKREASPCWASFGFIHMQRKCVSYQEVLYRWLRSHPYKYQRQVAKQLTTFFPIVHKFVSLQMCLASEEVSDPTIAMEICLALLDAILAEAHARGHILLAMEEEDTGDSEVLERFMVWCLTWGLSGTAINDDERKKFTLFVKNATSVVTPGSVESEEPLHDWAIDLDTGLWVRWNAIKEDEAHHMGCGNIGGDWLLPTPELLSTGFIFNLVTGRARPHSLQPVADSRREHRRHELTDYNQHGLCILGRPSGGKTLLMHTLLSQREQKGSCVVGRVNWHPYMTATKVQDILEGMLQPTTSGSAAATLVPLLPSQSGQSMPKKRYGVFFLDDMHLASSSDSDNVWSMLRQLASDHFVLPLAPVSGLCKFPFINVQNMSYVVAMTSRPPLSGSELCKDSSSSLQGKWSTSRSSHDSIRSRSLTFFVPLNILPPSSSDALAIISRGLMNHFVPTGCSEDIRKTLELIVKSLASGTVQVVQGVGLVFPASSKARALATMDLRKMVTLARRLCVVQGNEVLNKNEVVHLFLHEAREILCDAVMMPADRDTCLRHIATVSTNIFSSERERRNKRGMAILETRFLKHLHTLQFAEVPTSLYLSAHASWKASEDDMNVSGWDDANASVPELFIAGVMQRKDIISKRLDSSQKQPSDDTKRSASGANSSSPSLQSRSSKKSDLKKASPLTMRLNAFGERSRKYVRIKQHDKWLIDLMQVLQVSDEVSRKQLLAQSLATQLVILRVHRFLSHWCHQIGSIGSMQHGDQDQYAQANTCSSNQLARKVLVVIEIESGASIVALSLAAMAHSMQKLVVDDIVCEADRRIIGSSQTWDSEALQTTCARVVAATCQRIASCCGLDDRPLMLVCKHSCPHIALALMQVLMHGNVYDYMTQAHRTKMMADALEVLTRQEGTDAVTCDVKMRTNLLPGSGDLVFRARMFMSRRVRKNLCLVFTVLSESLLERNWNAVPDSSAVDPRTKRAVCDCLLSLNSEAECIFKDCHYVIAQHPPHAFSPNNHSILEHEDDMLWEESSFRRLPSSQPAQQHLNVDAVKRRGEDKGSSRKVEDKETSKWSPEKPIPLPVTVQEIKRFPNISGYRDKTDPVVELMLGAEKCLTTCKTDAGGTAMFNETLIVPKRPADSTLTINVYDKDAYAMELLGEASVDLQRFDLDSLDDPETFRPLTINAYKRGKVAGQVVLVLPPERGPEQELPLTPPDRPPWASSLASRAVSDVFEACGLALDLGDTASHLTIAHAEIVAHLVNVPATVMDTLNTLCSHGDDMQSLEGMLDTAKMVYNKTSGEQSSGTKAWSEQQPWRVAAYASLGLECRYQQYVEEFSRLFRRGAALVVDTIHRHDKVVNRLWHAQTELDELEREAKVQVGLSVSVKVVIKKLLSDLQIATSKLERLRTALGQKLHARQLDANAFVQRLGCEGQALLSVHQDMLLSQADLQDSMDKFAFDTWVMKLHQQREDARVLRAREAEERASRRATRAQTVLTPPASSSQGQSELRVSVLSLFQSLETDDRSEIVFEAMLLLLHRQLDIQTPTACLEALQHMDCHHAVSSEDLELLAPLIDSPLWKQEQPILDQVSSTAASEMTARLPGQEQDVEKLVHRFLHALYHYHSAMHARHNCRLSGREDSAAEDDDDRTKVTRTSSLRRTKSSTRAAHVMKRTKSVKLGDMAPGLKKELQQITAEDKRVFEDEDIIRLHTEVIVQERTLDKLQLKLDDAVARKLRIMTDTLRLRNTIRKGREAVKWIKEQALFAGDERLPPGKQSECQSTASRLGAAAFLSRRDTDKRVSMALGAGIQERQAHAAKRAAAKASLQACLLVYLGPLTSSARESILDHVWFAAISAGLTGMVIPPETPATPASAAAAHSAKSKPSARDRAANEVHSNTIQAALRETPRIASQVFTSCTLHSTYPPGSKNNVLNLCSFD